MAPQILTDNTYACHTSGGMGKAAPVRAWHPVEPSNCRSVPVNERKIAKPYRFMECNYESGRDDRDPTDERLLWLFEMHLSCKRQWSLFAASHQLTTRAGAAFIRMDAIRPEAPSPVLATNSGLCFAMDLCESDTHAHHLGFP